MSVCICMAVVVVVVVQEVVVEVVGRGVVCEAVNKYKLTHFDIFGSFVRNRDASCRKQREKQILIMSHTVPPTHSPMRRASTDRHSPQLLL